MNYKWGSFGLICAVLMLAACNMSGDKPDARQVFARPPFAAITDSISQFPSNADLYLQRAALLSQNNMHELATGDYRKAWELQPNEGTALEYASNLLLAGDAEEGIAFLKNCTKKYPANTEFRRRLSEIYAQQGKASEAIAQYDAILGSDSSNFMAWLDKGMLLGRLGDTGAATLALEKSFSLQPTMYAGLELANMYAASRNPKTIAICDQLLSRDSVEGLADVYYIKGTYFFNTNQYAEALKLFDESIRQDWKFIDAYLDKGIILFEQRNYDEALEVFSKAALVSNRNPDAYYWMGRCYEATGQKEQAIENYKRTLQLDRTFTEARERIQKLAQ